MFRFIREMSDVHLEFGSFSVPELDTDSQTVLILSGDIHIKDKAETSGWMASLSKRFYHVFRVLGNHEHYRSSLDITPIKIRNQITEQHLSNVSVLDNDSVILESVAGPIKFIGSTMWTDLNKGCPHTMWAAEQNMNDFKYIRFNNYENKWNPRAQIIIHRKALKYLVEELKSWSGTTVVITHHAPHQLSIGSHYKDDHLMNGCYRSDLSDTILDYPQIKFWFHGHIHDVADYFIGDTRIICNPRGYVGEELVDGFDPLLLLDLQP